MPALPPPPPPITAPAARQLPPLSFLGFRAGMPVAEARSLARRSGGSLDCKATSDARMRECNGSFVVRRGQDDQRMRLLVSSVRDSAAVIVLSGHPSDSTVRRWVTALTQEFGIPRPGAERRIQWSWEWVRRSRKLVVVERRDGGRVAGSVTLTDGPLLDELGPFKLKGPD